MIKLFFRTERNFCGGFTIRWAIPPVCGPGKDLQGWYPDEDSWEQAQFVLMSAGHLPLP